MDPRRELSFEYHLGLNQSFVRPGNESDQRRAERKAGYYQALSVSDAMVMASGRLLTLTDALPRMLPESFKGYVFRRRSPPLLASR